MQSAKNGVSCLIIKTPLKHKSRLNVLDESACAWVRGLGVRAALPIWWRARAPLICAARQPRTAAVLPARWRPRPRKSRTLRSSRPPREWTASQASRASRRCSSSSSCATLGAASPRRRFWTRSPRTSRASGRCSTTAVSSVRAKSSRRCASSSPRRSPRETWTTSLYSSSP